MGNQTTEISISNKIEAIVSKYKSDFERVNAEEKYKWEAIGHYKEHWDIDADSFASMYMEAFKEAGNLLAAGMYYPYKMIGVLSERDPEKVRSLFRMLYDETIELSERYVKFRSGCDEVLTEYRESDEKIIIRICTQSRYTLHLSIQINIIFTNTRCIKHLGIESDLSRKRINQRFGNWITIFVCVIWYWML